jgi:NADPH2:quinone reductase
MEAVRIYEYGGPQVLRREKIDVPAPGPGEALVRLDYSGVNYLDIRQRTGDSKVPLPATLGTEGAGIVEATGSDRAGVGTGDRVAWQMKLGTYATHAIVPVEALVPLPDEVSTEMAAAVLLQGLTASVLAQGAYAVTAGETCLVHAAAGGVGGLLCQIVKMRGARAIGTVSSAEKIEVAREAGADEVLVHSEPDFVAQVRARTGGRGVDVVYDSIGRETFDASLESVRPLGYVVVFGQASGAIPPVDTVRLASDGGRYLTRATVLHHITDRQSLLDRSAELFGWITSGRLHVRIAGTYGLGEAAEAHRALSSRRTHGKLLLKAH